MVRFEVNVIVCTDPRRCAYTEMEGRTGLDLLEELQQAALDPALKDQVQVTECRCIFGCTYGPRIDVACRWNGDKVLYGSIDGAAHITRRGLVLFSKIPQSLSDLIYASLPKQ